MHMYIYIYNIRFNFSNPLQSRQGNSGTPTVEMKVRGLANLGLPPRKSNELIPKIANLKGTRYLFQGP